MVFTVMSKVRTRSGRSFLRYSSMSYKEEEEERGDKACLCLVWSVMEAHPGLEVVVLQRPTQV